MPAYDIIDNRAGKHNADAYLRHVPGHKHKQDTSIIRASHNIGENNAQISKHKNAASASHSGFARLDGRANART